MEYHSVNSERNGQSWSRRPRYELPWKPQPTFIRAWRQHRGMTLAELAHRMGTTHATLSRVERGKQPYNQNLLEMLAAKLRTNVASLLRKAPPKR